MHEAPSLDEIQSFLNHTRKYNVNESYTAITDQSEHYRNIRVRIQDFAKKVNENPNKDKSRTIYNDLPHICKESLKFFQTLGEAYYSEILRLTRDYETIQNIRISNDNKSTYSLTYSPSGKPIITANITLDATGLMTLCQALSDAHVLSHSIKQEKERDQLEDHLVEKTTNMFISTCLINYITKDSKLTNAEIDLLQYNSFKELEDDTLRLEADEEIFHIILDAYPEAFATNLENLTPLNFLQAMEEAYEHMSTENMDKINARIKEIAEKGNTARYIQGEVAADLAGMEKAGEFNNYPAAQNQVTDQILDSIENTHVQTNILGKSEKELIEEGGSIVTKTMETTQELQKEAENENENVMVKERTMQSNNSVFNHPY